MKHLQKFHSFWRTLGVLTLTLAATMAHATERVLLAPNAGQPLAAQADSPEIATTLQELRDKTADAKPVRVIVGLHTPFAPEGLLSSNAIAQQRQDIVQMQATVISKLPSLSTSPDLIQRFETIPFMGLTVTRSELDALLQMPEVTSIEEDKLSAPTLSVSVPHIGGSTAWDNGYTGAGQAVAVLDTGVDKNHPFLTNKVVSEACYSSTYSSNNSTSVCPGGVSSSVAAGSGMPCANDCAHGTHVAGIVAGNNGISSAPAGVAKDAKIIAIQVFSEFSDSASCNGSPPCPLSYTTDQIKGLERVYALRSTYNIASVNMSLGGGKYTSSCDASSSSTKAAIDQLRGVGIATVIASGNNGYIDGISSPACISSAISVGATWARAGYTNSCAGNSLGTSVADSIACYSNSASILDLLAPGSGIISSVLNDGYASYNGTSMATPHVAGAWAVMKQKKPTATVDEVLNAFITTGNSVTDPRNSITKPRINLGQAVTAIGGPTQLLSVSKTGSGTITSNPAGIDCGSACSVAFLQGASVTLTATPSTGYAFTGWGGACAGTGTCTVTMSVARNISATFTALPQYTLTVSKTGAGTGTVTSQPALINCGSTCSTTQPSGTTVTLTATPALDSTFSGWSGACTGTGTCSFNITSNTSVVANFGGLNGYGTVTALNQTNLASSTGVRQYYSITVPSNAKNLLIQISGGTGDADLYVKNGANPTPISYDCRPYLIGNNESCFFPTPAAGTYYIMLDAFSTYSGLSLHASYKVKEKKFLIPILNLIINP